MGPAEIVSLAVVVLGAVGGVLAYFKYKPGQREQVDMTIAQATMNVAQGTFQLVTTELEDQFKRMSSENKVLRDEFNQYRDNTNARLAELATQLRAEKAEKIRAQQELEYVKALRESERLTYQQETERLTRRVSDLEAEVSRLKVERP